MNSKLALYNMLIQHTNNIRKWEKQIEELKDSANKAEKKNSDVRLFKTKISVLFKNITYAQKKIEKINLAQKELESQEELERINRIGVIG